MTCLTVVDLQALQEILGYTFRDESLLRLALTHPSASGKQSCPNEDNQRMEFLGDAILQAVISDVLYSLHPNHDEGTLTKTRAALVNGTSLAAKAAPLGLENYLTMSRGQQADFERGKLSALEDALEALVAALFLDGGMKAARDFVRNTFAEELANPDKIEAIKNPKGELQELLQAKSEEAPTYDLLNSTGPDHNREFEVVVKHLGQALGQGKGSSKKAAETSAALAALASLQDS